jgi:hypothetical protein
MARTQVQPNSPATTNGQIVPGWQLGFTPMRLQLALTGQGTRDKGTRPETIPAASSLPMPAEQCNEHGNYNSGWARSGIAEVEHTFAV